VGTYPDFFLYTNDYVAPYTGLAGSCRPGDPDCAANCAVDVRSQYEALKTLPGNSPTGQAAFRFPGYAPLLGYHDGHGDLFPPLHADEGLGHIQGFSRIPGLGDGKWFVFSRNIRDGSGPSGLVFAHASSTTGQNDGRPLLTPPGPSGIPAPPVDQALNLFVEVPGTVHTGGIQVLGNLIVVGSWCSDSTVCSQAMVSIFKVESSASAPGISVSLVNQFEQGGAGLPGPIVTPPKKAHFVSAIRMSNGHYVVFMNRNDRGWASIMVSSETRIDHSTQWSLLNTNKFVRGYQNGGDTYQNMNFVRECGTNDVYALGFSQNGFGGRNEVDLFRTRSEDHAFFGLPLIGEFDMSRVGTRLRFANPGRHDGSTAGSCEMKGGGGMYVTPAGQIVIYCSQGKQLGDDPIDTIRFSEFAAP